MTARSRSHRSFLAVLALTAAAVVAAGSVEAQEIPRDPRARTAAEEITTDPLSSATVDSSDIEPSAAPGPDLPPEPPAGGDIRLVGVSGIGPAVSLPGVRHVGSGWNGHRATVARGVLPASLTDVTLRGRWTDDWLDRGLDLLAVTSPSTGVLLAPTGPDISLWPVFTAEWPVVHVGGTAPLSVDIGPLRRPAAPAYSRLTGAIGPDGRSLLGAEFGRGYAGGAALAGFYEAEDGHAPTAGGGYGIDRAGGSALLDLRGDWIVEAGGTRSAIDRSRPVTGPDLEASARDHIRTDLFVRGSTGGARIELFHTQSWLEARTTDLAARAEVDGLSVGLGGVGPLDAVAFQLERREVSGALISEPREAASLRAQVSDTLSIRAHAVTVVAGAHALDGDVLPLVSVATAGGGRRHGLWTVEASLAGRHPTALELAAVPSPMPAADGGGMWIGGSPLLRPERAAVLSATYRRDDVLSGVGASGDVVHVFDPIVLGEVHSQFVAPVNAVDETGGALSVWAAVGDTSGAGGGLEVSLLGADEDGALNCRMPVPSVRACCRASMPFGLFDGYLRSRVTAEFEYEAGLARGPWAGLLDDERATLSVALSGAVDAVQLFLAVDNVLSTDSSRLPGMAPGGAAFSAGFSWHFRD